MTTEGYIYCLSNESMPGLLKVGMTTRSPEDRARELHTTGIPLPFKVDFAKKVTNPNDIEALIHGRLSHYHERVNPRREFFRVSPEEVKALFDLTHGVEWAPHELEEDDDEEENITERGIDTGCRDMNKCFSNGQRIRHGIGGNNIWIGTYDSIRNGIIRHAAAGPHEFYKSLSGFANAHHRVNGTYKNRGVSGWSCTDCEVDNDWISTSNLKAD